MKPLRGVSAAHNLNLLAPIDRWDEAIPLGNGLIGALLWGAGNDIKISLDRGDLWDLRRPEEFTSPKFCWKTITEAVARGDQQLLQDLFEKPNSETLYPTKLPTGRLELSLEGKGNVRSFHLDLRRAVGRVEMERGTLEMFCSAAAPVVMIRVTQRKVRVKIVPPAFGQDDGATAEQSAGSVGRLRYPPPRHGKSGNMTWVVQQCADGLEYVIAIGRKKVGQDTVIAATVVTSQDAPNALIEAKERINRALKSGYNAIQRPHEKYWRKFWSRSAVQLPDKSLEQHYYLVNYFYGSASRRGFPPIPLQGVWTADDGTLPPWKGDYHHDLNTQLTYWPYLAANHLDEGLCFLDFMWNLMPAFRANARDFYSAPGACVPTIMSLDGKQMGGWHQYAYSPINGIWIAHQFYRHWRYTMDRAFLGERAYPFCLEHSQFIQSMLRPDEHGKLKLALSSSPEIHDNRLTAWMKPNSNYDLSLMRWLFGAVAEMAAKLGKSDDAEHHAGLLSRMDDLAVGPQANTLDACWSVDHTLYVAPGERLAESHRHFSHLMALHPLGTLHVDGTDHDRKVIYESLRLLDHLGFSFWCGYSFAWMACMSARCAMPDRARQMLRLYLDVTVSRNGFHLNGDYKQQGVLAPTYRPFTLEGNFAAIEAVHEMVLQGWNNVLRIFPATPADWSDVAFDGLRAEGAFIVSARRSQGSTTHVRVVAEAVGLMTLRDPFNGKKVRWNRRDAKRAGCNYILAMKPGDVLEGRLAGAGYVS